MGVAIQTADSTELRFSFPFSPTEHARALKASMYRGPAASMTRGMAVAFGVIAVVLFTVSLTRDRGLLAALTGASPWLLLSAFWGGLYRALPLRLYRGAIRRTMPSRAGTEIVALSDEGLFWSDSSGARHIRWDAVREVTETAEFVLFHIDGAAASFVPKHTVPIEAEETLRALLARKFSSRPDSLHLLAWGS